MLANKGGQKQKIIISLSRVVRINQLAQEFFFPQGVHKYDVSVPGQQGSVFFFFFCLLI